MTLRQKAASPNLHPSDIGVITWPEEHLPKDAAVLTRFRCVHSEMGESPLPPEALVLRGGSDMSTAHLTERFLAFATRRSEQGLSVEYAISVNSIPELEVDDLAARANLVHSKVRASTVAALLEAGFIVEPTPGRQDTDGHCSVYLKRGRDHAPNGIEISRLREAFGSPIANTGQRKASGQ